MRHVYSSTCLVLWFPLRLPLSLTARALSSAPVVLYATTYSSRSLLPVVWPTWVDVFCISLHFPTLKVQSHEITCEQCCRRDRDKSFASYLVLNKCLLYNSFPSISYENDLFVYKIKNG